MAEHTEEPWRFDVSEIVGGVFGFTTVVGQEERGRPYMEYQKLVLSDEDARRIVACVNACAGIPTGALEAVAAIPADVTRLMTLRDKAEFHAIYSTSEG